MKSKIKLSLAYESVTAKAGLGLDEGTVKAVWPHLEDGEKRDWLDKNPDSKAHKFEDIPDRGAEEKAAPDKNPGTDKAPEQEPKIKDVGDASAGQTWWDKMSADEQDVYLSRHPKSRRRKTHVRGGLIKHAVLQSSNRVHHAVRSIGKSYRRGMRGIRNLKAGRSMSEAEKTGLKKTGLVVATVVVAALAAAALFTPLGGAALDISTDYLTWMREQYANVGTASAGSSTTGPTDRATLKEFHDGMLKWLLDQEPDELTEKYGKKS